MFNLLNNLAERLNIRVSVIVLVVLLFSVSTLQTVVTNGGCAGDCSTTTSVTLTTDSTAPNLQLVNPPSGALCASTFEMEILCERLATVYVNGANIGTVPGDDGLINHTVSLNYGINSFLIYAIDYWGNQTSDLNVSITRRSDCGDGGPGGGGDEGPYGGGVPDPGDDPDDDDDDDPEEDPAEEDDDDEPSSDPEEEEEELPGDEPSLDPEKEDEVVEEVQEEEPEVEVADEDLYSYWIPYYPEGEPFVYHDAASTCTAGCLEALQDLKPKAYLQDSDDDGISDAYEMFLSCGEDLDDISVSDNELGSCSYITYTDSDVYVRGQALDETTKVEFYLSDDNGGYEYLSSVVPNENGEFFFKHPAWVDGVYELVAREYDEQKLLREYGHSIRVDIDEDVYLDVDNLQYGKGDNTIPMPLLVQTNVLGAATQLVYQNNAKTYMIGETVPMSEVVVVWDEESALISSGISDADTGRFKVETPSTLPIGFYNSYVYSIDLSNWFMSSLATVQFEITIVDKIIGFFVATQLLCIIQWILYIILAVLLLIEKNTEHRRRKYTIGILTLFFVAWIFWPGLWICKYSLWPVVLVLVLLILKFIYKKLFKKDLDDKNN